MTLRKLQSLKWELLVAIRHTKTQLNYYGSAGTSIVAVHAKRGGRTNVTYLIGARRTTSPTVAIRWLNQNERQRHRSANL